MHDHSSEGPRGVSRRSVLRAGAGLAGAALLAACSRGNAPAATRSSLSFMYWGSSYEDAVVRAMLRKFGDQNDLSMIPLFTPGSKDQFNTKMNVLVASGDQPDATYAHDFMAYSLAERGLALNLYDYFDNYPDLADRLPGTYYFWDDGKCLGTETGPTVSCLYYNKPAFDSAGVSYPPATVSDAWDWDEFVHTADRLTVDDNGTHPSESGYNPNSVKQFGVSGFFTNFAWYAVVRSNGGDLTNPEGTKYTLDSPEAIEALQHLQDLTHDHRVSPFPRPGSEGAAGSDTSTDFRSRRVAMSFDGTWAMLNLNQEEIDFGIGVYPRHQECLTVQQSGCTMLSSATRSPQRAVEFYLDHNNPHSVTELFTSGLWMPLERKYYTDEDSIRFWTDNDNHPAEFRTAVIEPTLHHSVTNYGQRLRNMARIRQVLEPAIEVIQQGRESAETVCKRLRHQLEPLLAGAYPNPMEAA